MPAEPLTRHTDRELLARFLDHADEAAFRTLMERHCALVMGVALRTLHDRHAAEDVLQATFLVLAQKARGIRRKGSLSSWLHGVAGRISLRTLARRRRRNEQILSGEPMDLPAPLDALGTRWEQQVLDDELQLLPENLREPLILYELEGHSCAEIAAALSLSVSAVEGRLRRGRKQLKHRLLRRGIGLGGVLVAVQALQADCSAAVASALIARTADTALAVSTGKLSIVTQSTEAARLAQQEILAMTAAKTTTLLTVAASLVLAGGLLGVGVLSRHLQAAGPTGAEGSGLSLLALQAAESDPAATPGVSGQFSAPGAAANAPNANPMTADYGSSDPSRRKFEAALQSKVDLEFIDTELSQAIQYLSDTLQIPILPNEEALAEAGIGLDTPLNLTISEISLDSALNLMLKQHGMDYVIENEVLMITSREAAEQTMETRVYELRQLPPEFRPEDIARVIIRNIAPASWGENAWVYVQPVVRMEMTDEYSGSTMPPGGMAPGMMGYGMEGMTQKPVQADTPTAAIETLPGCLVITQSQRRHRQITDLLQQLQQVPVAPAAPGGSMP